MDEFAVHDRVVIPDHEESRDEDWDLSFLPNLGIDDYLQSLDGDCSKNNGGEGPSMQQCNYVQLHAVHEHEPPRMPIMPRFPSPFIFHMSRHNFSSPSLLQLKQIMVVTHRLREMASKVKVAVERGCNLELAIESPCSPIIGRPYAPPRVSLRDNN